LDLLVKRHDCATFVCSAAAALAFATPSAAQEGGDADWSFDLTGRLQLDATAADAELTGFSDSLSDAEVRRARVGVDVERGALAFRAEVEIDVEDDDLFWQDIWAQYAFGAATLGVGQWKPPVTLEHQTSSRFMLPFERASIVEAFGLERRLGVLFTAKGERHTVKAGVFGGHAENDLEATAEGTAAAARVTYNPTLQDELTVHLGASALRREAADDQLFRYRARPRIHLSDRFVDTGAFADEDTLLGVEAGVIAGRVHLFGELAALAAEGPLADADLGGGYLEGGVFLTPDALGYKDGVVDRTRPSHPVGKGGLGAWQLRGRIDWIDLSDGPVAGGEQTAYSLGVNWFLTDHLRLVSELTRADIEDGPDGSGEVDSVSVRAAVDW
jgi:phosphate-selective porin OprO/OprP